MWTVLLGSGILETKNEEEMAKSRVHDDCVQC